jgi:SAM-dependent methyltransferase
VGSPGRDPKVAFVEGSALSLPFANASFDVVCLFDVIEHLPRGTEDTVLREVHRVLESGGKLYFSTPYASPIHAPLDPVWSLGHRHYRRSTIGRLLRSTGFVVDRLFVAGGVLEALDHIRLLLYKHLMRRKSPPIALVHRLIEQSHGRDHWLGTTIFVAASR